MRTSFACDLETMERLVSFEREYSERYSLPTDSARKAAVAALTALSKSINK